MEGGEVPQDDTGLYKFAVSRTVYVCVYVLYSSKVVVSWSTDFFSIFEDFLVSMTIKLRTVEAKKSAFLL